MKAAWDPIDRGSGRKVASKVDLGTKACVESEFGTKSCVETRSEPEPRQQRRRVRAEILPDLQLPILLLPQEIQILGNNWEMSSGVRVQTGRMGAGGFSHNGSSSAQLIECKMRNGMQQWTRSFTPRQYRLFGGIISGAVRAATAGTDDSGSNEDATHAAARGQANSADGWLSRMRPEYERACTRSNKRRSQLRSGIGSTRATTTGTTEPETRSRTTRWDYERRRPTSYVPPK